MDHHNSPGALADPGAGDDEAGVQQRIVSTVVDVNDRRKKSMADRVARAMGGDLSVRSSPGEGATFTLALPSV